MKLILKAFLCIFIVFSLLIPSCSKNNTESPKKEKVAAEPKMDSGEENKNTNSYKGKKVLFIDSYHEGYAWSDGITNGIKSVFDSKEIELSIFRMDTKRNGDEAFKKSSAEKAKAEIESQKPDAVIVSDDNATNLVLARYYKDSTIPFIFCGVNWDASTYGLPYKNATGMVEVSLTNQMISILGEYKEIKKIGYLSADNETERKNVEFYKKFLKIEFTVEKYAKNFEEWKSAYKSLQNEVDVIIIENNAGIEGWNDDEAHKFALENKKIPACSPNDWMNQVVDLIIAKVAEEQGKFSANTAMKIFAGTKISDIKIEANKEGQFILNTDLAKKIGISFKPELLKMAEQ